MKRHHLLLSFFLLCTNLLLAQADSTQLATTVAEEGPMHAIGLGVILISFSLVFLAAFTVLVILLLAAAMVFLALAAAGVVSVATLYGFQKRSFSAGVKALMWMLIPAAAATVGWLMLWLLNDAFNWQLSSGYQVLIGLGGGFLSGALLTVLMIRIGQLLLRSMMKSWSSARFNK